MSVLWSFRLSLMRIFRVFGRFCFKRDVILYESVLVVAVEEAQVEGNIYLIKSYGLFRFSSVTKEPHK